MTTLAVDKPRDYELGEHNDIPVVAGDIIFEGAAVGLDGSGFARPLVAGDVFVGFALRKTDNTGGAAGDKNIRLINQGTIILPVTGLTIDDVGKPVYASDDDTFTMTAGANTQVGAVKRYISDGWGAIEFWVPRAPATVTNADIANDAVTSAKIAADAVTNAKIADNAVSLENLDAAITPSHIPVFSGEVTWSGGLATLNTTVTGALATDIVVASIKSAPTQAAYLAAAAISAADTLALTLSAANTSNDAVISYTVLRAAA